MKPYYSLKKVLPANLLIEKTGLVIQRKNNGAFFSIVFTELAMSNKIIFLVLLLSLCTIAKAQMNTKDTLVVASNVASSGTFTHNPANTTEQKTENESFLTGLLKRNNISGGWWGVRNILNESGLDFNLVYKGEMFSNVSGGLEKGTTTLDNIDLILSADLGKSMGFENSNLLIQFLGNSGGVPCNFVGAAQGISNIETIPTWKVYQLILEKKFFNEQFSVAVGLYDLNSEFDYRETSSIFINPSHGIGPDFSHSGLNGPSIFPTTSVALRIKYESENGNYFQAAILDGVPGNPDNPYGTHIIFNKKDGLLLTSEFGSIKKKDELLDSKIALGVWTYTTDFEKNNFTEYSGNIISLEKNYGLYLTAEKKLVSNSENPNRNLAGFFRIGYANKNINPVDFYFGGGLKLTGLFSGREEDELGLAVALAHTSSTFRKTSEILENTFIKSQEIDLEVTYIFKLTPWLIIQPDIQYLIDPSYCTSSGSAFVMGSRVQLIF